MSDAAARPARLLSLDVFRGATIAAMILVNNPGEWGKTWAPLLHAEWHGWTPTDLVFPFFLFAVGAAIPFSFAPRLERGEGVERKVWRRALLLFALGLALTWFPYYTVDWSRARIPGVLQRIAVVYLVAALAYLRLRPLGRALLGTALLLGHGLVLGFVAAPGGAPGDLSPQGNVSFWLDARLLGTHVWRHSPGPGDPEGILSTLGAIATALQGIWAGEALRKRGADMARGFAISGSIGIVLGLLLDRWQPINKNLWTPAYVFFTGGAALLLLGALHLLADRSTRPRWTWPLVVYGRNSILAFVGSGVLARLLGLIRIPAASGEPVSLHGWLYGRLVVPILPDYLASLAWAALHVLFWLAVLAWLDRRRIYLKI